MLGFRRILQASGEYSIKCPENAQGFRRIRQGLEEFVIFHERFRRILESPGEYPRVQENIEEFRSTPEPWYIFLNPGPDPWSILMNPGVFS